GIYGTRKVLMEAAAAFAVISFLEPFSPNLQTLLLFQFMGGLATGFFIPLTLSFVLRNTPPKAWAYGIAIYALNLEVSLNISASLEGWYTDHISWQWIFWQNVPLALGMAACLYFGVKPEPTNPTRPRADIFGFIYGGCGFALIYAALDQGNRTTGSIRPSSSVCCQPGSFSCSPFMRTSGTARMRQSICESCWSRRCRACCC